MAPRGLQSTGISIFRGKLTSPSQFRLWPLSSITAPQSSCTYSAFQYVLSFGPHLSNRRDQQWRVLEIGWPPTFCLRCTTVAPFLILATLTPTITGQVPAHGNSLLWGLATWAPQRTEQWEMWPDHCSHRYRHGLPGSLVPRQGLSWNSSHRPSQSWAHRDPCLPWSPKCWDFRRVPPHPASWLFFIHNTYIFFSEDHRECLSFPRLPLEFVN